MDEEKAIGHAYPPAASTFNGPRSSSESNLVSVKPDRVFGTAPCGIIGTHKPREIIRLERDYSAGELPQFYAGYPPELEGRVSPTQHAKTMNALNACLSTAYDPYKSIFDNVLAILSLYLSTLLYMSHYQKEMAKFSGILAQLNKEVYNPVGLNILDPAYVAYLFLEIEYY